MLFFAPCQAPEVLCICGCCYSFVVNLFGFMLLGLSLAPLVWTFTSSGDFKTFSSHFFECLFRPGLISFSRHRRHTSFIFCQHSTALLDSDHLCKSVSSLVQIRGFLLLCSKCVSFPLFILIFNTFVNCSCFSYLR